MRFVPAMMLCVGFAFSFLAPRAASAADYPEPSPYPISWEFSFEHDKPKRIVVTVPGKGPRAFWYMTYTVTNNTGQEREFLPSFEMLTKDGKVLRSEKGVPQYLRVFEEIKRQENSRFLQPYYKVAGPLRVGEDQARDGVAIWPEPMSEMGNFSIFVGGLSGESVTLKRVDGKLTRIDPRKTSLELKGVAPQDIVSLNKTLQLNFVIYGDEVYPGLDEVNVKAEQWVMR